MASHLIFYLAIAGYRNNNNSQQQPIASLQTSKQIATWCKSAKESENHHKHNISYMHDHSSTSTLPILYTSNDLICDYNNGIQFCHVAR